MQKAVADFDFVPCYLFHQHLVNFFFFAFFVFH